MPPLHPPLVHFPVALVTLSVAADALGNALGSASLHEAGWWALLGAAIGAALSVLAGLYDMSRARIAHDAHERVHKHMRVGLVLLTALAALTLWRWQIETGPVRGLGGPYLVAAFAVLGLTFYQGWLGGRLVFAQGVGVSPTGQGTEPLDVAVARACEGREGAGGEEEDGGHPAHAPSAGERGQEPHGGDGRAHGERLLGEHTMGWALAGLLIGATIGCATGIAFGGGRMALPGLAPIAAGGRGVAGFLFALFLGSACGLVGALLGARGEARHSAHRSGAPGQAEGSRHRPHDVVRRLPVYGAMAMALAMAATFLVIGARGVGSGEASDQGNRVTWNQKNAIRVGGTSDAETSRRILEIAWPSTRPENSPNVVLRAPEDWRAALALTPLIAPPTSVGVVLEGDQAAAGVLSAGETIAGEDPAVIAATADERRAAATGEASANVLIVSAEADFRWAAPAGAYAARTGTPILFVTAEGVPPATATALRRRAGRARIFVLGPTAVVSSEVVEQLGQHGEVTRIGAEDVFTNAVRFAEFRDPEADFGWGHTGRGTRQFASMNTILVGGDGQRWQDALMAAQLARRGKAGPLLFTEREGLPAVVDNHLWRQRPAFEGTPAEGPFNHVWVVGSFDRISYETQARADYSQEITQYMTLGDSAVSGYEALGIGWAILSVACATWIAWHATRRLPEAMPMMKAAWAVFALLLGPLAAWLYVSSYHGREKMEHGGMVLWRRPLWLQAVSATVMMFAFDMMLMCLAVFLLAYGPGFPLLRFEGPLYWLGSSMLLMMVGMFLLALVAMVVIFHTPMTMHEKGIRSYGRALLVGLPIMAATMAVESVGMMPTMWWQQMIFLPAMQMPTEDDMTMWTTLYVSVFVAFLVVLPFNAWLVKTGRKMGGM